MTKCNAFLPWQTSWNFIMINFRTFFTMTNLREFYHDKCEGCFTITNLRELYCDKLQDLLTMTNIRTFLHWQTGPFNVKHPQSFIYDKHQDLLPWHAIVTKYIKSTAQSLWLWDCDYNGILPYWLLKDSLMAFRIMQAACDIAFKYVHERKAFGQKIGTFQVLMYCTKYN